MKRHFREMDRDIQASPFTVVGVGDMSGDVFGNGMLLSPQIRLIAAFDHRDIFIDPDPDPKKSLAERQRLFDLPRSSWQDYDKSLLSKGGGVYSRTLKNVALFQEARRALGLGNEPVTPQDVITAILKADVDLLWFGGIGTYVRGAHETNAEAGDKANDAIRITGSQIRARVVGEGANLAVTQMGRIDYAHDRRPHRHRRHRQFGRRQRLRHRGQHQDRAVERRARRPARCRRPQRFPRRNDRRGRRALPAEQLPAAAGHVAGRSAPASPDCPITAP